MLLPFPITNNNCTFPFTESSNCAETFAEYYGDTFQFASIIIGTVSFMVLSICGLKLYNLYKYKMKLKGTFYEKRETLFQLLASLVFIILYVFDPAGFRGWIHPYVSLSFLIATALLNNAAGNDVCIKWIKAITNRRVSAKKIDPIVKFLSVVKYFGIFIPYIVFWIPIFDENLYSVCILGVAFCMLVLQEIEFLISALCGIYAFKKIKSATVNKVTTPKMKSNGEQRSSRWSLFLRSVRNSHTRCKLGFQIISLFAFSAGAAIAIIILLPAFQTISVYEMGDPAVSDESLRHYRLLIYYILTCFVPASYTMFNLFVLRYGGAWKINVKASNKIKPLKNSSVNKSVATGGSNTARRAPGERRTIKD